MNGNKAIEVLVKEIVKVQFALNEAGVNGNAMAVLRLQNEKTQLVDAVEHIRTSAAKRG